MRQILTLVNWTPTKVICCVFGCALMVDSVLAVWGESRPVGSFFEELVARSAYWALLAATFGSAIYLGIQSVERTHSYLVGWAVGISTFLLVGFLVTVLISNIPGVGWRFERLLNSQSELEY